MLLCLNRLWMKIVRQDYEHKLVQGLQGVKEGAGHVAPVRQFKFLHMLKPNQVREILPQLYPTLLMPEEMRIQATTSP